MNARVKPTRVTIPQGTTTSLGNDIFLRSAAQSYLIGLVDKPDPPTIEQARDILAWAKRTAQK